MAADASRQGKRVGGNDDNDNKKKKKKKEKLSSSDADGSSTVFPMSRVWRLVRGEAGHTPHHDSRTTTEAVFLINKASEMFLQRFAQDAHANAVRGRRKSITYHNLSSTVNNGKRYEFLSDFVPEKVRAEDAMKARASVLSERLIATENALHED